MKTTYLLSNIFMSMKKDIFNNDNGPALLWKQGQAEYWLDGILHRLDGPAIYDRNSETYVINGVYVTKEEFDYWIKNNGTEWNNEFELLFNMSYS